MNVSNGSFFPDFWRVPPCSSMPTSCPGQKNFFFSPSTCPWHSLGATSHTGWTSFIFLSKEPAYLYLYLLLYPQHGNCCVHHRDLDSRAKNVPSCHDPLCIKARKSNWHKGRSVPLQPYLDQIIRLELFCGTPRERIFDTCTIVHLWRWTWRQTCHSNLLGGQARNV